MKNKNTAFVICLLFIIMVFCGIIFWKIYPIKYKEYITKYSLKYSLSNSLVSAIICAESRFNSTAKSTSGACGLMQLMPSTYEWVSSQIKQDNLDIFDPEKNIEAGCFYLNYLFTKYVNKIYVLACYNAGEGIVKDWESANTFSLSSIKYVETKNYVIKVLKYEKLYQSRF